MKYTDPFVRIVFFLEVQRKIQQQTAVLSSGKGYVDVIKFCKYVAQSVQQCIQYIFAAHCLLYIVGNRAAFETGNVGFSSQCIQKTLC